MTPLMEEFEKHMHRLAFPLHYERSERNESIHWLRSTIARLEHEAAVHHRAVDNMAASLCGANSINSARMADDAIAQARSELAEETKENEK